MSNVTIFMKPSQSALSEPLWMAAHASDWGDALNQCHRGGGKQNTTVMMFWGGVVLMLDGILVLFLL
jgi:hypothetical protein